MPPQIKKDTHASDANAHSVATIGVTYDCIAVVAGEALATCASVAATGIILFSEGVGCEVSYYTSKNKSADDDSESKRRVPKGVLATFESLGITRAGDINKASSYKKTGCYEAGYTCKNLNDAFDKIFYLSDISI